jgi:hypothetical protein
MTLSDKEDVPYQLAVCLPVFFCQVFSMYTVDTRFLLINLFGPMNFEKNSLVALQYYFLPPLHLAGQFL